MTIKVELTHKERVTERATYTGFSGSDMLIHVWDEFERITGQLQAITYEVDPHESYPVSGYFVLSHIEYDLSEYYGPVEFEIIMYGEDGQFLKKKIFGVIIKGPVDNDRSTPFMAKKVEIVGQSV